MQAVIFDMDDTLYAERDFVLSGFRAVAQWAAGALAIPAAAGYAALAELFAAGVRGDTFNRWLERFEKPAEAATIQQVVQVYREHTPQIRPFPAVPTLLSTLRQSYRIGLLSDGYLQVQQRKFRALGLADCFDAVVFSDEWGRAAWKPSIRPFVAICERLGVGAETAVYVADNPTKDFLGARQVGLYTIWLRRQDAEYTHLTPPTSAHAPHATITELTALPQALTAVALQMRPRLLGNNPHDRSDNFRDLGR